MSENVEDVIKSVLVNDAAEASTADDKKYTRDVIDELCPDEVYDGLEPVESVSKTSFRCF